METNDIYSSSSNADQTGNGNLRRFSQHFEADIRMFGDKTTLTQIVLLLAYLRYHIQNKIPGDIKVSIGKKLETDFFNFSVNDEEIQQVVAQKEIEIN